MLNKFNNTIVDKLKNIFGFSDFLEKLQPIVVSKKLYATSYSDSSSNPGDACRDDKYKSIKLPLGSHQNYFNSEINLFMKYLLLLAVILLSSNILSAQYVYTIKADSVKITNSCDTAELILENHTQNVLGFLYNKGRGRTEFRKALIKLNDTLYQIGADSLSFGRYWRQGGNTWGTTGILGTRDNNHVDIYTNDSLRARWTNLGQLLIGTTTNYGYKVQVAARGRVSIDPVLSRETDHIRYGGTVNATDGQNVLIATSADGVAWKNVLVERNGFVGLGTNAPFNWNVGNPPIRVTDAGVVSFQSTGVYYGNTPGPANASALISTVSNTNEWTTGGSYPNGQNHYFFGTTLGAPSEGFSRAPLRIGAKEIQFYISTANNVEGARLTTNGNLLVGMTTEGSSRLDIAGSGRFTSGDIYEIKLVPNYNNGWMSGVHGSMLLFGNIHASIGVNKQVMGNIPSESLIMGVVSPNKIATIADYGRNPTFTVNGNGQVTINGGYNGITTGGTVGTIANSNGFNFNINGSLGTGNGTAGDIILATANSTSSGTTIHSMTNRWWIKGGTGYLSNNSNPTSNIDINGSNGYSQFRLRTTYTPGSTADSNGNVGDFSWDDNYFYIKTSAGWKRSALSTF